MIPVYTNTYWHIVYIAPMGLPHECSECDQSLRRIIEVAAIDMGHQLSPKGLFSENVNVHQG